MAKRKESEDLDYMKKAEEIRSSLVSNKKQKIDKQKAFHKFFIKIKDKLNLSAEMENVLWRHLVATKNDSPDDFKNGIENFGYKIK